MVVAVVHLCKGICQTDGKVRGWLVLCFCGKGKVGSNIQSWSPYMCAYTGYNTV